MDEPKTKETSFTYPRGILKGRGNFVPRKVVSNNIKTAKRKKKFNMLNQPEYKEKSNKKNVVPTIIPIIKSKKKKSGRRKTAKTKKYTLKLDNEKNEIKPVDSIELRPIISKSFDANGIKKFMDAITYDGVMEMTIKKE